MIIYSLDVLLSQFGTSSLFCLSLIVAFLPTCRFLWRQVSWSGIPFFLRIFHSLLWSTVKALGAVNKAQVDVLLKLSCIFYDPMDVGNLISFSSAFSKSNLNFWKFFLENFERYFASMWNECSCVVVWTFFGIAFLWNWNENWPFPVLWPLLSYPNLLAYWAQHFNNIF